MFERYRRGDNAFLDVVAGAYDRARAAARAVDDAGAFAIDRARRRRRKLERVERLELSLTETIGVLSELQTEVGDGLNRELADAKAQLHWVLTTLRG